MMLLSLPLTIAAVFMLLIPIPTLDEWGLCGWYLAGWLLAITGLWSMYAFGSMAALTEVFKTNALRARDPLLPSCHPLP